jgi:IS5 family transposase
MLRVYCLQQWYNLSDPGAEKALYDIHSVRAFCGLELGRNASPETTILNFRHLLERHDLTKAVFAAVAEHLEARCALLRGGTIVDATLIAASPSTKNREGKRDLASRRSHVDGGRGSLCVGPRQQLVDAGGGPAIDKLRQRVGHAPL